MSESQSLPAKNAPARKDWTQGPILKNLVTLSWPMVVMELLFVTSQVVDMIWIGRLGSSAVAGAGIANILMITISSVDYGLIVGVRAMVSRSIGAGNIPEARKIAAQSFLIGICWGALVTALGLVLGNYLINIFDIDSEVAREGWSYLQIVFAGWISMDVLLTGLYVLQATGDSVSPMKIEGFIRIIHIALCPFLVLGIWVFPQLGVVGAALSNIISQIIGALIILYFFFSGRSRIKLALSDLRFNLDLVWRILKIGIPALIMVLQRAIGNVVLMWFITPFGTLAVAAHSLASRIEMFIYLPCQGLGAGAGVLVGQNLGAKKPERAEKSAWLSLGLVEVFMVASGIIMIIFANNIMSAFATEPGLIDIGASFLRIAVAGYLLMAVNTVLQNGIGGAGDTLPNMIISILMIWVVQMPAVYLLSNTSLGVYGIRWGIVAATVAGTIATLIYFRMGRWKLKKV